MSKAARQTARFEALYRRGSELLHRRQPAEATPILERAHELDPDHHEAALNLSGAYILTGQFAKAAPILEKLAERDPDNPSIWTNLGAAYLGNPVLASDEQQRRAIRAFEHALRLDPVTPHVAYNLGLIYRGRQERERARYWFGRALVANPHDENARTLLGRLSDDEEE
jgi:tetratricopeptide (TPR) repeat protein